MTSTSYLEVESGKRVELISVNEYKLKEFSPPLSIHTFTDQGEVVDCILVFYGDGTPNNRYAGPIVIYKTDSAYFITPKVEFFSERFERIE